MSIVTSLTCNKCYDLYKVNIGINVKPLTKEEHLYCSRCRTGAMQSNKSIIKEMLKSRRILEK